MPNVAHGAQAWPAPRATASRSGRQAGGRKGALPGPDWNDFTANVNSGSDVAQTLRSRPAGKVATCGTAQPQSQLMPPQQSPAGEAAAGKMPMPFNTSRMIKKARKPVTAQACAGLRLTASESGPGSPGMAASETMRGCPTGARCSTCRAWSSAATRPGRRAAPRGPSPTRSTPNRSGHGI